jgi:hypothetical protein
MDDCFDSLEKGRITSSRSLPGYPASNQTDVKELLNVSTEALVAEAASGKPEAQCVSG